MESDRCDPSDESLVQRAQYLEDRDAFAMLVRRHQGPLRGFLRRLTYGDLGTADDLAQEAFLRAYRGLKSFRAEASFRTWLVTLAYRVFLDHRAAVQRQGVGLYRGSSKFADVTPGHVRDHGGEGPMRDEPKTSGTARLAALAIDLDRALSTLTEAQRLAVLHCHFAGLTYAEAAQVLGWPAATLQSHLRRATGQLRVALKDWANASWGDDHED
jgi:RNA polymerase sigma factor (sigma-70 family)